MSNSKKPQVATVKDPTIFVYFDITDPDSDGIEMHLSDVQAVMDEHGLTEDEAVQFLVDEHFDNKGELN